MLRIIDHLVIVCPSSVSVAVMGSILGVHSQDKILPHTMAGLIGLQCQYGSPRGGRQAGTGYRHAGSDASPAGWRISKRGALRTPVLFESLQDMNVTQPLSLEGICPGPLVSLRQE